MRKELMEVITATAIKRRAGDPDDDFIRGDMNASCAILRSFGGYGDVPFDVAWANRILASASPALKAEASEISGWKDEPLV